MDKIVLVTGSTDGIGKQTALELAKKGAYVLIHGKDTERCHKTVDEIAVKAGNNKLQPFVADFSSLKQVRKLAQQIKQQYQQLDVLINNAGVYERSYRESEDGLEMTFAVNHMAPFVLTLLLLDIIKQSPQGRIINVSSISHYNSPEIDFDDLNLPPGGGALYAAQTVGVDFHWFRVKARHHDCLFPFSSTAQHRETYIKNENSYTKNLKKNYDGYKTYCQSKLCNILFTYELAARLKATKVTANCLHPGVIDTKLLRSTLGMGGASVVEGAKTSVYLATAPELESVTGKYFSDGKESESSSYSHNIETRKKLWETSLQLTPWHGINY